MTIHDDAWDGSLNTVKLKSYLESGSQLLNQRDDEVPNQSGDQKTKGITPLIGAVIRGHVTVVEDLLQSKADPDIGSKTRRTPLEFAATRTSKNRAQIIKLLLAHHAEPNVSSPESDGNTPLMLVISHSKDIEAISYLVDAKASLTMKNQRGETAADLAKKTNDRKVIEAVEPKEERAGKIEMLVNLILALIVFILAWVNNPTISDAVKGTVSRLYQMDRPIDPEMEQRVNSTVTEPQTMEDFQTNVTNYIEDVGLDKFFGKNNQFLETVAANAVALKDDPTTSLGDPENLPKVLQVSMYQSVLYCDDSGSMMHKDDSGSTMTRFDYQKRLVDRITKITTVLIPDNQGVELRFINYDGPGLSNLRKDDIAQKMNDEKVKPRNVNLTEIGYNLEKKILKPLLYDKFERDKSLERPLLISIITDGCPRGDLEKANAFVDAIIKCGDFLEDKQYPRTAVKFQISQIGASSEAEKFLADLRKLKDDHRLRDVLHCSVDRLDAKFNELRDSEGRLEKWLLTTMMECVTNRGQDD